MAVVIVKDLMNEVAPRRLFNKKYKKIIKCERKVAAIRLRYVLWILFLLFTSLYVGFCWQSMTTAG